jgi:hypothetical protein
MRSDRKLGQAADQGPGRHDHRHSAAFSSEKDLSLSLSCYLPHRFALPDRGGRPPNALGITGETLEARERGMLLGKLR